ncbi:hypothetical protein L486_02554 [Kwoniella mangroviensis CBS 10435]|uniref:Uncharacterized protein n=1 Tax=Kwoniella mangroviensis CBS 10435 TaxID=1331196 RepID=A0A1B9IWI0_9TREE|nr:hypothetical protein L486_02554 [Kwoniella mangroviensis CBS 10435]
MADPASHNQPPSDHPHPHPHSYSHTQPSPTLLDTPHLSGPSTPIQPETPHTIQLQTPTTHAEGSSSSSSPVNKMRAIAGGEDKGKGRAEVLNDEDDDDEVMNLDALRRISARVSQIEHGEKIEEGWVLRDELLGMVKSILPIAIEQIPFLQERLSAQRDTIKTMQQQAKLSAQLMSIERSRHTAERDSWHAETRALMHQREAEIAAGTRPRKVLDLDVGYHQELEAANKRLEMDNRLMAPRLADTQRQIDKLVTELRYLRSHVILNSQPISKPGEHSHTHPQPPISSYLPTSGRRHSRSPIKGSSKVTMGDARTEHLLLAAERVRNLRQYDDRVGRLTLDELKRNGVVGPSGGVGFSEGYGGIESEAEDELSEEEEKPLQARRLSMSATKSKGKASQSQSQLQGTPLLPRPKKSRKNHNPPQPPTIPQTPSKSNRKQQHPPPQTTPGGSNFNDLLRAAELATRPGTPTPEDRSQKIVPLSAMSATRSTTRARDESASERGSPIKRVRRDEWSSGREDELPPLGTQQSAIPNSQGSASALDLLAQASQLEVAKSGEMSSSSSSGPLPSATRLGDLIDPNDEAQNNISSLGPAIDLTPFARPARPAQPPSAHGDNQNQNSADPNLTTPKNRPRAYSGTSDLATPVTAREYPSSTVYPTPGNDRDGDGEYDENDAFASPAVPGLGKYVHLTSSLPARRIRSPYLKWTVEEDELLARAVAIHGEKWDLVSKGVPTRSYHQVRQRWLRKTGAFDKKGNDGGNGIINSAMGMGMGMGMDEDDESPTPDEKTPTGKKKRRMSQV